MHILHISRFFRNLNFGPSYARLIIFAMHSISLAPLYVPITILRRARLVSFWQAGPAHTLHRLSYGPDYTPEYAPYKWDGIFGILQHSHRKGCAFALTRMCQARTVTLYRRPQKYSDGSLVRGQSMMHGVPSPCQMNFEVCPDQPTHTHTHTHTTGRYLCPVYTYIYYIVCPTWLAKRCRRFRHLRP